MGGGGLKKGRKISQNVINFVKGVLKVICLVRTALFHAII